MTIFSLSEDKYAKTMRVEGESYRLSILDTAGEVSSSTNSVLCIS